MAFMQFKSSRTTMMCGLRGEDKEGELDKKLKKNEVGVGLRVGKSEGREERQQGKKSETRDGKRWKLKGGNKERTKVERSAGR